MIRKPFTSTPAGTVSGLSAVPVPIVATPCHLPNADVTALRNAGPYRRMPGPGACQRVLPYPSVASIK
jgi:hypothetical protein